MLSYYIFALAPILSLLPSAAAHGILTKVVIDGKSYTGSLPSKTPSDSPIRQVSDVVPVKGADNPSMNCGLNAQVASMVVPANPGSSMEFYWGSPLGSPWPHNTGPVMTYMAACDTSTCDKFNGSTAKWFKIDQIGKTPDGNTWYQKVLMNGSPISLTLPKNIAPGDYLVRNEVISLQLAVSLGGAEFFPSCTQIRISGSQTGTPNQTVSFPGAYNDHDPGIYDPNLFQPNSPYTFPGPPVSNLASPADMTNNSTLGDSGSGSSVDPAPTGSVTTSDKSTSTGGSDTQTTSPMPSESTSKGGSGTQTTSPMPSESGSLSRRNSGIAQHKRRVGSMRAIRDASHFP